MQCTHYFPGFYSHPERNGVCNGGPWPVYSNDLAPNMSGRSYNNFYPPPNVDQMRIAYHDEVARQAMINDEVLRQTMLRHENIFREQVQELHRLHRRQRELMGEFKRRGLNDPNAMPMSRYDMILSKVSSDYSSMTWQSPKAPALPWLNPAPNKLFHSGSQSSLPAFSFLDIPYRSENSFENSEVLPPMCKKPKRKMLDLELPADEHVENEEEKGNQVHTNSYRAVDMMAFDLNMPPTLLQESEIFQTNMEKDGGKPDYDNNPGKDISEYHDKGVLESKSKINRFDLNSCIDEDEPSSTLLLSRIIEPVSPENKESSPPRGESEENHLKTLVQISKQREHSDSNDNLVSTAAETIFLISKSTFNEETKTSLLESLDWFAGVVVSSMENDPEAYDACLSSNGSGKEEAKCIVALPSQEGKRHRKRRTKTKISGTEVFRSLSSLTSYNLGSAEKGFKSWGKVNKRRRGRRVQGRSVRVLWS